MTAPNLRKSPASFALPRLSYRVWKVWQRNFDVFTKTATVNFLPSLLEPILYLVAFGFGLGGFIPTVNGQHYINYIAPALVAISIMNGANIVRVHDVKEMGKVARMADAIKRGRIRNSM